MCQTELCHKWSNVTPFQACSCTVPLHLPLPWSRNDSEEANQQVQKNTFDQSNRKMHLSSLNREFPSAYYLSQFLLIGRYENTEKSYVLCGRRNGNSLIILTDWRRRTAESPYKFTLSWTVEQNLGRREKENCAAFRTPDTIQTTFCDMEGTNIFYVIHPFQHLQHHGSSLDHECPQRPCVPSLRHYCKVVEDLRDGI